MAADLTASSDLRAARSQRLVAVASWSALALLVGVVIAYGLMITWPGAATDPVERDLDLAYALLVDRHEGTVSAALTRELARLVRAEGLIERAAATAPDHPDVPLHRGLLRFAEGDFDAAAIQLDEAVERAPGSLRAHLLHGSVLYRAGRNAEAEDAFRRAALIDPDSATAQHALGQVLWLLDRKDEALEAYRRKLAIEAAARGEGTADAAESGVLIGGLSTEGAEAEAPAPE